MTIDKALSFIHSVSWLGSKPGLSRTRELLERLGDPQKKLSFVHIAGTNGKGSVAAMLASILRAAGYVTGLYTSPYIGRFNERMQINGADIQDDVLCEMTGRVAPHALAMKDPPTEFELVTALAFEYFAESGCDLVVLETGMGGRLDSTNVIEAPECAVVTRIGLDHTRELGDTLEQIAEEKCGIIKAGCAVVLYSQTEAVENVVRRRCGDVGASLRVSRPRELVSVSDTLDGQVFTYGGSGEYTLRLLGGHQLKNAAVVLEAVDALRAGGRAIPAEAVKAGLASAVWPARFEPVSQKPWLVVDGGHNPQCAESVVDGVDKYFPGVFTVFLIGVLADKDYASLCDILAERAGAFVAVAPDSPRALPPERLAEHLARYGKPVRAAESLAQGVGLARALAGEDGLVVSVGSLYMAGGIRAIFGL